MARLLIAQEQQQPHRKRDHSRGEENGEFGGLEAVLHPSSRRGQEGSSSVEPDKVDPEPHRPIFRRDQSGGQGGYHWQGQRKRDAKQHEQKLRRMGTEW